MFLTGFVKPLKFLNNLGFFDDIHLVKSKIRLQLTDDPFSLSTASNSFSKVCRRLCVLKEAMSFLVHWLQQCSRGFRFSGILRSVDTRNIPEERRPRPRRFYVHGTDFNVKAIILKNVRMIRCTVHI